MRNGLGQHLKIRLRDGHGKAEQKAHAENEREIPRAGERGADLVADGGHGDLGAEGEQAHAHDDQHAADQKAQKNPCLKGRDRQAQHGDNEDDRQGGAQGFLHFFDNGGFAASEEGFVQRWIPPFCAGRD